MESLSPDNQRLAILCFFGLAALILYGTYRIIKDMV